MKHNSTSYQIIEISHGTGRMKISSLILPSINVTKIEMKQCELTLFFLVFDKRESKKQNHKTYEVLRTVPSKLVKVQ